MVEQEGYMSKLFNFKGKHKKSLSVECGSILESSKDDDLLTSRSRGSNPLNEESASDQKSKIEEAAAVKEVREKLHQEMDQMKERFAKLLLGEDMSGKGTGVSSALALSNAFTNLAGKFTFFPLHLPKSFLALEDAAAVFGETKRLEPMPPERKARWRKEIDWLLSVTEYIVEMVPSHQTAEDGSQMEDCLDNFQGQSEFYYVSKDSEDESKRKDDDKWWLPTPKVPPEGLPENARKFLQHQKDCVNQVLKAAMAINAQVISEMEIPENYIESLPKNGRASLGDSNYRSITVEYFDPDQFLITMDLESLGGVWSPTSRH